MESIISTLSVDEKEFPSDSRIYFSRESNTYRVEDDDGTEWEFLSGLARWVTANVDDAEFTAYNAQFALTEADQKVAADKRDKKRKADEDAREEVAKKRKENEARRDGMNKAIFVTGLPPDADTDEIYNVFSKCGLIDESWDTSKPRIKMYYDGNEEFKGEALIVFYKPESVAAAISRLNGTDFRMGALYDGSLTVTAADRGSKTLVKNDKEKSARKPHTAVDLQKMQAKRAQMDKRLAWDSDDEDDYQGRETRNRWDRLVILRPMFTLNELAEDPTAYQDTKDDIREACEEYGEITSIVLYDGEPNGVVTVRFKKIEAADACIAALNGRSFGGRTVRAKSSDGTEKFRKAKRDDPEVEEARLNAYREEISKTEEISKPEGLSEIEEISKTEAASEEKS